ncbi:MAG TPA: ABC transporter substrate-binding protein [Flavipsychrobacter sp.]|nr:ABC transporter substrate-binding protein [Flavipsychrobacter sp.]
MNLFSRNNLYKWIGYVLIIWCYATSFSCKSPEQKSAKKTFRLNLPAGVESLDPAFAKDINVMWTVHMLYNTLVETDEHLHLVPSLATHWTVSSDGLTYTFYLRNDVYFHDNPLFPDGKGRKMTAADVVYSFRRIIDPAVASTGAWIFNDKIAAGNPFVAINDTVFQIKLKKPFRPLPEILSMPYCSIVPKEVAEHWGKDFRNHPCGTGPFQFHYWDEGNVLVFYKNPHYWEKDSNGSAYPYIDAVMISFYESKATEFLLFMQGKIDFVNGVDGSFKDLILSKNGRLKKEYEKKFHLDKRTYLNTEYIGFVTDTTNPIIKNNPIKNKLVRQAINYAIDRKKIVTYLKNGEGIPAEGGFIPEGMPGYDSSHSYGYNYNPAKALQLLKSAGYPNGNGIPALHIYTPDNFSDVVNFVASELQDIGIKVQVEIMQPAILKQQMSRSQAMMFRAQWIADYPDAETYLAFFNSQFPAPPNYSRFKNDMFDRWYDESMNEPDTMRWKMYKKMDSLAMSYAPVIPLFYDQLLHFTQNNISGFTSNPMNLIELKKVKMK